jgi:hypothetical protein
VRLSLRYFCVAVDSLCDNRRSAILTTSVPHPPPPQEKAHRQKEPLPSVKHMKKVRAFSLHFFFYSAKVFPNIVFVSRYLLEPSASRKACIVLFSQYIDSTIYFATRGT